MSNLVKSEKNKNKKNLENFSEAMKKDKINSYSYLSVGFEFIFILLGFSFLSAWIFSNYLSKDLFNLGLFLGFLLGFFFAIYHLYRRTQGIFNEFTKESNDEAKKMGKELEEGEKGKQRTLYKANDIDTMRKELKLSEKNREKKMKKHRKYL